MAQVIQVINYRGTANIYYSAHGDNLRISTGVKVNETDIDKNGKIKSSFLNKNSVLLSKVKYVEDFIKEYQIKNQTDPKVNLIKSIIKEKKQEVLNKNHSLVEFFEKFFEEKKSEFSTDKDKSISSLKDYKSFWNSLLDYQKYKRIILYVDDLDLKQLNEYRSFMYKEHIDTKEIKYATKGDLNQNTFRKRIIVLKTFYYWLLENKIINEIPYFIKHYAIQKTETNKEVLTSEEILLLYQKNFEPPWLNRIKDAFVFACHTGMRFSDLTTINKTHYKSKNNCLFVRKRAEKVNEYFMVPLTDVAIEIALKYNYKFDFATNQVFNKALKTIFEKSELFNEETEKLGDDGKQLKRYELIHSHSARHSFITNLVNKSVPISEIMSMTGHKKLETLNIYIKKKEPDTNETLNSVFLKKLENEK